MPKPFKIFSLINVNRQEAAKGQIICIDESSLVSVPQFLWAFEWGKRNNCRIITGDEGEKKHDGEGAGGSTSGVAA